MKISTLEQNKNSFVALCSHFFYAVEPLTDEPKWHKMVVSGSEWEIRLSELPIFMFIGEFHHTLDEKGRLAVPIKFRVDLAQGAVVTRGLDRSLFLYPKSAWEELAKKLSALPLGQADTRAFARLMLAGAMDVDIDKAGRVMIPEYLRTYAGLSKDVVVTGLYDRIEIWDEATWKTYASKTEDESNQIAERLGNLV